MKKMQMTVALLTVLTLPMAAQQTLTLEDCRRMALESNQNLVQSRTQVEMAGYDRKIAFANYLPSISATGAYVYNNRNLSLVTDEQSAKLTGMGTLMQGALEGAAGSISSQLSGQLSGAMAQLQTAIQSNPALAMEYMGSPMWQTVLGMLQQMDLSGMTLPDMSAAINSIGSEIDEALHPDLQHVILGTVTLQQPVFAGGKILYANQIARLAEELARSRYDQQYADALVEIDQAYWQIVSLAAKRDLATSYAALLHELEKNVEISVQEGVATQSDALQIKVKANEADMLKTKAEHGMVLAKMLLCKEIGLPLDSDIRLADEGLDYIPAPASMPVKDMDSILADRPETRSLNLASEIYEKKADVARADMMPTVALVANYMVSNPNAFHGLQNTWDGGMFSAGVLVSVPIFHGGEALQKTRKAKAEATLYRSQLEEAENLIRLQVTQNRQRLDEAGEKVAMAENNLANAEENLRAATIGFEAGVIETNTVLAAQTAWLQAHSELIDAGIERQMNQVALSQAEGNYHAE